MSEWISCNNVEALQAKMDGHDVQYYGSICDVWENQTDYNLPPSCKYRYRKIEKNPMRYLGKWIMDDIVLTQASSYYPKTKMFEFARVIGGTISCNADTIDKYISTGTWKLYDTAEDAINGFQKSK